MKTETMQRFDALVDTIRREVQRLDDDEVICQGELAEVARRLGLEPLDEQGKARSARALARLLFEHVQPTSPKTDPRLQQVLDTLHENYSSMVTTARPVTGGWEIRISSGALAAVVTIYTSGRATTGGKDTSLRRDARSILEGLGYDVRC